MRLFVLKLKYLSAFLIVSTLIIACTHTYPPPVEKEMARMSKENRKKYEKVFRHYHSAKDSLKLKAAYFLVENINDFGFYVGRQINNYNVIFDVLAHKPPDYRENLPWYATEINLVFDSLQRIYGPFTGNDLHWVSDADVMTRDFMVKYIDEAFEAWNQPWSRQVSFDNFCEYILPYRNFTEPIEDWRPQFMKAFAWINDSIKPGDRMMDVARKLNRDTELKYSSGFDRFIVSIAPSRLLQAKYGNCADNSNYKAMIMRAFGIPVTVDYFPQYGTDHNIHYWNAIMYNNDKFVSFKDSLNDINALVAYKYTIAKAYRRTFSRNPEMVQLNIETGGQLPPVFRNARLKDVTNEYVPVTDVDVPLRTIPRGTVYAFLAVFNDAGWTPIDYARIDGNSHALFRNLGRNVVYMPLCISDKYYIPAGMPFKITSSGEVIRLEPQQQTEKVVLTRKYHFHRRKLNWLQCLKGGRFEGANQPDFSDAVTLATIRKTSGEHYSELRAGSKKAFKYFRFVFSPEELKLPYDGDGASIAEIECYNKAGQKLNGTPFGSPGRKYNPYVPEKCFDGNALTFFEDARPIKESKYVGLEFGQPETIGKIRFIPRNDMNTVQPGDRYELFYWNNNQFQSLGQQTATDTLLIYRNVPVNSMLWLRDLSGGQEERIFTWENGKQVWW
jgi:hypothetical protein